MCHVQIGVSKVTIPLFRRLEIETHSTCNRRCPWCIRNSIPDKETTRSWFETNILETEDFVRILDQALDMGFHGEVCLSHYNEPLMDERIIDLANTTRSRGFSRVFMCSNADFLTEELARQLDGVLNDIGITLYMDEPKRSERASWIKTLFTRTRVDMSPGAAPMITHFSPLIDIERLVRANADHPCHHPLVRMIVNHRGEMLMCCDDLTGHFDLGTIHESTLAELWYGERHQRLVQALQRTGGRSCHSHCRTCPRS